MTEIVYSHKLLFQQNLASQKIGMQFYGSRLDDGRKAREAFYVYDAQRGFFAPLKVNSIAKEKMLKQFPYLAPRMVNLLEKIENWSPRSAGELLTPGYTNRLL